MNSLSQVNVLFAAWLIALAATCGALFLGEVMGRTPCVLCWYQRIAMFPMVIMLGIGTFAYDYGVRRYVLPLALGGGAIALWHTLEFFGFVAAEIRPCTLGGPSCVGPDMVIFSVIPIPILSLAAFVGIGLLLVLPARKV